MSDIISNLIAHYTMDNVSGATLVDETAAYNGTITGAVQAAGKIGQALSFDGSGDYVVLADALAMKALKGPCTISLWVLMQSTATNKYILFAQDDNNSHLPFIDLHKSTTDQIVFQFRDNSAAIKGSYTAAGITGTFFHCVIVVNQSLIQLWIDNVKVYEVTPTMSFPVTTSAPLTIGTTYQRWVSGPDATNSLSGKVDIFRLYERVLAADDIAALYAEGNPPTGTAAILEAADTAAAAGTHYPLMTGTAAILEAADAVAAAGYALVAGSAALTEASDVAAAAGYFVEQFGSAAFTEGADVAAATGYHDWLAARRPELLQAFYTLTLTGGAGPILLPLASFQATMNLDTPSYLSCQVPNANEYADEIAARAAGTLQIRKGYRYQGIEQSEIIAAVTLSEIRTDEGERSATASLTGYQAVTAGAAKPRTLSGIQYRNISQGRRRVRCSVDLFLDPGDTAIDGATSFTVGSINYYVGTSQAFMEVQEAAA
jgi:hypothetical protein